MKINSTSSVKDLFIKCLIYGSSGAGKTTLAGTLNPAKTLVISAEAGLLSVADKNIDYIDITVDDNGKLIPKEDRVNRLVEAHKYLQSAEAVAKYDTVFVDSLTEISQCMFDRLKKDYPERKDSLPLYGDLAIKTRDIIKAFRDLPGYNVVFTCLATVDKDESGKRFAAFDVIGGISGKLPQFFDFVAYLRTSADGTRELVCDSTDSITAKNRGGKLSKTEPANLTLVFDKIKGVKSV